jgi:adenine-specific DNA-methyltransferase
MSTAMREQLNLSFEQSNLKTLKIHNRRYLGSKYKLISFIEKIVKEKCGDWGSFCDLFAGTGVVGSAFNESEKEIITNDILYSNYVTLSAWLSATDFDKTKIKTLLNEFQVYRASKENYFSDNFGGKYFSDENARKIGYIREQIRNLRGKNEITNDEKNILLTALIYSADRIANTCGHYDAYRETADLNRELELRFPLIPVVKNKDNKVFRKDANELVTEIETDIVYIDPPYNSRQYSDTYHLLENLAEWKKPEVFGKAGKMDRSHLKSDYCTQKAPEVFDDLIKKIKAKYILVSYNNIGKKGNHRSNAKISDDELKFILEKKGSVEIFSAEHQKFTTGKDEIEDHKERIFFCEVTENT